MNRALLSRTAAPAVRAAGAARLAQTRNMSGLGTVYNSVMRSNTTYVTFIVVGSVIAGTMYNKVMDGLWASMNAGKLYHHIDWSKFVEEEEEEEEE